MYQQQGFKALEKKGLAFSQHTAIDIKLIQKPKQTLVKSLSSIMLKKNQQDYKSNTNQYFITNFLNEYFLVGKQNTLTLFQYQLIDQNSSPTIKQIALTRIETIITKIHTFARRFMLDNGYVPIIIQSNNILYYYKINFHKNQFQYQNQYQSTKIIDLYFTCQDQLLLLSNQQIIQLKIINNKLQLKKKIKLNLSLQKQQILQNGKIIGHIDPDQQSLIKIIYSTINKSNQQTLKVKQYIRKIKTGLQPLQNYFITQLNKKQKPQLNFKKLNIQQIQQYICIQANSQIIIIKKKFDQYLLLDCMIQKINGKNLYLSQQGIIISISNNSFQLNYLKLGDPKCQCKLFDQILNYNKNLYDRFHKVWYFTHLKQPYLMFVFSKDSKLYFLNLVKMDPMEKLLQDVEIKGKKDVKIVQQLGENLGIEKHQFYLTLWNHSKKQICDIYQLLLPCQNIYSIKRQVRSMFRRRYIAVSQFIKISQKMINLISTKLKTQLSLPLLKQYAKNCFLARKVKLYGMDTPLDFQFLQKIYNMSILDFFIDIIERQTFPKQQKVDPLLNIIKSGSKYQDKNLKHVFQQFKLSILQNYKKFLGDILHHFNKDIVKVITNYPYLLPNYPFHMDVKRQAMHVAPKPDDNISCLDGDTRQHHWFSHAKISDWKHQTCLQSISNQLNLHFPTSTINQTFHQLLNSQYQKNNRLRKLSLLHYSPDEFKCILDSISGIKLYLYVCQLANDNALAQGLQKSQIPKLIKLFHQYHALHGQDLETCRLYSQMHFFMKKHKIMQQQNMSIQQLIQLAKKPQNLVAMFFLGNHQKIKLILNGFKQLYRTSQQFYQVLQIFVFSQNCSRIQLYILTKQIIQKGSVYQIQNQKIIQIIIHGFCIKLQLRQYRSMNYFFKLIQDIQLQKKLIGKLNKINQIKQCKNIFWCFNWQKKSYQQVLCNSQQTLTNLIQDYFLANMKKSVLVVKGQQLNLKYPRNMLNILLYLKQKIFYQLSDQHILLIYGENLIQWKQFNVIKQMVYQEEIPQKLGISSQQYINRLMKICIDPIYRNQDIVWSEVSKLQILGILSLDLEQSPQKIKQQAKIKLIQLLQSWGFSVLPYQIWLMTSYWKQLNRNQVMFDLINDYIDHLNFRSLIELYQLLQITDKGNKYVNIENQQFISFSLHFAECLLKKNRFKDIIEVLAYVKSFQNTPIRFNLISQAFLQSICSIYSQDLFIAKNFIDFYTQNWDINQAIKNIFQNYFDQNCLSNWNCYRQILVDNSLCFNAQQILIHTDDLWKIAFNQNLPNQTLYTYFFLTMMIKLPQYALIRIQKISYNIDCIIKSLIKLENLIDQTQHYWGINTYQIFKKLRKGLYLQAITRIQNAKSQLRHSDNYQLQVIKNILKKDRQNNSQLLKNLHNIQQHINICKQKKNQQRKNRYQQSFKDSKKDLSRNISVIDQQQDDDDFDPSNLNITLKYKDFRTRKIDIAKQTVFVNQKDAIDQIYQDAIQMKLQDRQNNKNKTMISIFSINYQKNKTDKQLGLTDLILSQQFQKAASYKQQQIIKVLETIYLKPDTSLQENIMRIDCLKLGNPLKINIGRLCKIYKQDITDQQLKSIFPFKFFIAEINCPPQNISEQIFDQIEFNLIQILRDKQLDYIIKIANFLNNLMNDIYFKKRIYLLEIQDIALENKLTNQKIILLRQLLKLLYQFQQYFIQQIPTLLKIHRKNSNFKNTLKANLNSLDNLPQEIQRIL